MLLSLPHTSWAPQTTFLITQLNLQHDLSIFTIHSHSMYFADDTKPTKAMQKDLGDCYIISENAELQM